MKQNALNQSSWIQKMDPLVKQPLSIPMWKSAPYIDWKQLSEHLATSLSLPSCDITLTSMQWKTKAKSRQGFGKTPHLLPLFLSPISEPLFFILGKQATNQLLAASTQWKGFSDAVLSQGMWEFFVTKVVASLNQASFWPTLSLGLSDASLPEENAFTIDFQIAIGSASVPARIICPNAFYDAFNKHFASQTPTPSFDSSVPVSLSLRMAKVKFTVKEWNSIQVGDFLIIKNSNYNPLSNKGAAELTLEDRPILRAKLNQGKIKIVDFAFYEESTMDYEDKPHDSEETDFEENTDMEETDIEETADAEAPDTSPDMPHEEEQQEDRENPQPLETERPPLPVALKKVPLSITVELSRLKMSLDELLKLQPGNVLELKTESCIPFVSLTVEGKSVALGEVMQLGEVLGVKITKIEHQ